MNKNAAIKKAPDAEKAPYKPTPFEVEAARAYFATLADAILDRVVHNAYRIELSGESLRKRHSSWVRFNVVRGRLAIR